MSHQGLIQRGGGGAAKMAMQLIAMLNARSWTVLLYYLGTELGLDCLSGIDE